MAGGLSSLATYAQRSITFLLVGATFYYGAALFQNTYRLRAKRREKAEQEAGNTVNVLVLLYSANKTSYCLGF